MKKKLLGLALMLLLAISLLVITASAADVVDSGECGDNLTWTLDSEGLLTIRGKGAMKNYKYYYYDSSNRSPFYKKSAILTVVIESGVTSIGDGAFMYCSSLTSVTIPDSVTYIGSHAFDVCSGLTSVTIPDSVTSIEDYVFSGCRGLASVTIPDSVTRIGDNAFSGCSSLTSVSIPGSVTSIGYQAFNNCSSLTSVSIPNGVTSIEDYVFWFCSSLTSVTIPDSVTSIGYGAFSACSSLKSVTIPDSVTDIVGDAFSHCSSLTSVTIPDSVTSIGDNAFSGCSSLTNMTIPDGVTFIGNGAFSYCSSLKSVTIPDSVTLIGDFAFGVCSRLKSIEVSSGNTEYCFLNGILFTKDQKTLHTYLAGKTDNSYAIPDSVTSISRYAFMYCSSLTSVTIPDSVTSIGAWAFSDCGLKDVYYLGTEEQWNNIKIYDYNSPLLNAAIHYNCNGGLIITAQPEDAAILSTKSAQFTVSAQGNDLTYQWQYKTLTGKWKDCTAATVGYNTPTLTVRGQSKGVIRDGYQYRCKVMDSKECVISEPATLSVVKITYHPKNEIVYEGELAAFNVMATGADAKYQWQYKNPATGVWKNCTTSIGSTSDLLSILGTEGRNGYLYRCKVTCGGVTVTSDFAKLTVIPFKITSHPSSTAVQPHEVAKFQVIATGKELTYQWQYKKPDSLIWKNCTAKTYGYNTDMLLVQGVSGLVNHSGYQYRCKVTSDGIRTITSNVATLYVG